MRIEASSDYINRTSGLCGKFDGHSNDDRLGRDGLHKTTLSELAQSWNEEEGDCKVSDDKEHASKCEEVSNIFWYLKKRKIYGYFSLTLHTFKTCNNLLWL